MKIESHHRESSALLLNTSLGKLRVQVCSDTVLRVTYTRENDFCSRESEMIVKRDLTPASWHVKEAGQTIVLETGKICLSINRETGAFTWMDAGGRLLTKEPDGGGKTLSQVEVKKVRHEEAVVQSEQGVDGIRTIIKETESYVDRKAWQARLDFVWSDAEALYGLGQHEEGILNYRGHEQYLYQQNMKVVIPMLVSTRGYGILIDAYCLMTFHDDQFGSYLWADVVDELDYYFIYGPELDSIVAGYRQLTGSASMLPKWAFGFVQSKERYKTQAELIEVASEYRKRGIPLDVIVQDWQSWPEGQWGQKTFDPERFPSPETLTKTLHDMNVRMMISIWPIFGEKSPQRTEMKERRLLLENQQTYDAFKKEARELYWRQAHEGLFSKGIDAWWCDCTEPFEADWCGDYKPEPVQRLLINTGASKAFIDPQYINAYSLFHSKGIYEGQRAATDRKRVVNLTRSGYAGQQRYGTIVWSGDITARWETLQREIAGGLNFCASGFPYWTLDIGAFFVKPGTQWFWQGCFPKGCEDDGYRELYVRWFQFGAFLPMFRSHGTDTPREVWRFGKPGSVTYDTLLKFDFLRYRLMPYIYSLAGRVHHEHYTIMRTLAFDFRADPAAHNRKDQYMFGPAFLVNPVTVPMYFGPDSTPLKGRKKTRPVYLPRGTDWYDFWTGKKYKGGRTIESKATLDTMPLYVRAGSIIPMGPKIQFAQEKEDAPVELRVYPGADGTFTLYEDAGDSYKYEKGEFALTKFRWNHRNNTLTIAGRQGSFPGLTRKRTINVVRVEEGHGAGLEETRRADAVVAYEGNGITIKCPRKRSARTK